MLRPLEVPNIPDIATRQRGRNDIARKMISGGQWRFGRDRGKGTGARDATVLCVGVWVGLVADGGASKAPD